MAERLKLSEPLIGLSPMATEEYPIYRLVCSSQADPTTETFAFINAISQRENGFDREDPGAVAQIVAEAIRPVFDCPGPS
jgi:hypothetical protein